jgi:hypothetical protein
VPFRNSDHRSKLAMLAADTDADTTPKAELAGLLFRLEEIHIVRPTHLDVLCGGTFASRDARCPMMTVDFLAVMANRSELIATEIAKAAITFGACSDR